MTQAALIYPHQLFAEHPALKGVSQVVLVEEPLLFTQYRFHRQKLILHRTTMTRYAERLRQQSLQVHYVSSDQLQETAEIAGVLKRLGIDSVQYVDPNDDWLSVRLSTALKEHGIAETILEDPHFLTPISEILDFNSGKQKLFFTNFYIAQRKRLGVLLEDDGKPVGGKWSFDPDNRKKLPKGIRIPKMNRVVESSIVDQAWFYLQDKFPEAIGSDEEFSYPTDHESAAAWLQEFVRQRLAYFGDYEDAISQKHDVLFHSILTPMLNIGLLSPRQVLDAAMAHTDQVPLNSLEGFVRQVIGWREFVRLVYLTHGRKQRTQNFWGFTHEIPSKFYDASTGIEPVDHVIRQVLRTGYCHHIERLMILGNFLLLCEVHPDSVYRWFMELFIDAYDWVMVPNVYGMSQYADGGLMTTKPYLSGSNYVLKMSDFRRGPWCDVWDALYWRFVDRHVDFFSGNPRLAVMASMSKRLGDRMKEHHRVAEDFLTRLFG
jgi:deoxyribodipyrimidine photolyase-related protein